MADKKTVEQVVAEHDELDYGAFWAICQALGLRGHDRYCMYVEGMGQFLCSCGAVERTWVALKGRGAW